MLLFSRQGKLRLQKWYVPLSDKEKKKITRELVQTVLARKPKMCSFLEWRDLKVVYKRWAGMGLVREKKKSALWSNAHRIEYLTLAWAIRRPVIHGFMDTDSLRESGASVVKETMASWLQQERALILPHYALLLCQRTGWQTIGEPGWPNRDRQTQHSSCWLVSDFALLHNHTNVCLPL